ncbi:MAG: hypothetical protein AABZ32_03680, partial [Bacteroidota bacterium]
IKFLVDIYFGIGYRYRERVLYTIEQRNRYIDYLTGNYKPGFHTPPNEKYKIYDHLPSIHIGVQISILCKVKKHLAESE